MIGYKICMAQKNGAEWLTECINELRPNLSYDSKVIEAGFLTTLEIPKEVAVIKPYGSNKYRCSAARVVKMNRILLYLSKDSYYFKIDDEGCTYPYGYSMFNHNPISYRVGEVVQADSFDADLWETCSHGIHFFESKNDAIDFLDAYCGIPRQMETIYADPADGAMKHKITFMRKCDVGL